MLDAYPTISPELSDAWSIPWSSDIQRSKPNRINAFFSSAFSQQLSISISDLYSHHYSLIYFVQYSFQYSLQSFHLFWLPIVTFFSHFSWVSVVVPKNYVALSSPSHLEIRRSRILRSYQATFNLFSFLFSVHFFCPFHQKKSSSNQTFIDKTSGVVQLLCLRSIIRNISVNFALISLQSIFLFRVFTQSYL